MNITYSFFQRKFTSGESFTNVKMWRKGVSSNRLAIETLNYDKTYKPLAPYTRPTKATPVLLYKNGVTPLTLRAGSTYFNIPYVSSSTGASATKDGAHCAVTIPSNAYSIGIYLESTASIALSHVVSFGNPNGTFSTGQSAYSIVVDNIVGSAAFGTRFHFKTGGIQNIVNIVLKGLTAVTQFVLNINNAIKAQFSNPPIVASEGGGKVGFKKPSGSGTGSVVIEKIEGGAEIGLTEDLNIIEPEVVVFAQLPPTYSTGTINRTMFVY